MYIRKLTITPIESGIQRYTTYNPSIETASLLMKERLLYTTDMKLSRVQKKMLKHLKSWVNIETYVGNRFLYKK